MGEKCEGKPQECVNMPESVWWRHRGYQEKNSLCRKELRLWSLHMVKSDTFFRIENHKYGANDFRHVSPDFGTIRN